MPNPINEKVRILSPDSHNDFNLAKHFEWKEVAKHSCLEETATSDCRPRVT